MPNYLLRLIEPTKKIKEIDIYSKLMPRVGEEVCIINMNDIRLLILGIMYPVFSGIEQYESEVDAYLIVRIKG